MNFRWTREFVSALSVAASQVHSSSFLQPLWLVFPRHPMFVMRISYLIGAKLQQSSLFTNAYHSYFIKAIEHLFYEFTGVINPLGMLGMSQYPAWVYHAGKLIERVFYCLSKAPWTYNVALFTMSFVKILALLVLQTVKIHIKTGILQWKQCSLVS